MSSLDSFLSKFGAAPENAAQTDEWADQAQRSGSMDAFIQKFSGISDSFLFYNGTVEIKFDEVNHKYYLVDPNLGNLIPIFNVSTVSHIVDRSPALIPWTAKVTVEKMLRIIPTFTKRTPKVTVVEVPHLDSTIKADDYTYDDILYVPEMPLTKFTELCMEAKTAHSDKLEDAGEVGKDAHKWLEKYIKATIANDQVSLQGLMTQMCKDPRATNCVLAALDWMKAHNVRPILTERKVYSRKHTCSGTLDGLVWTDSCDDPLCCPKPFKDHLTLLDFKTSNFLYIEFLFQTAAYLSFLLEEFKETNGGERPSLGDSILREILNRPEITLDRVVLRLGKEDGEFQPWHLTKEDFEEDFAGFLACLRLKEIVDSVEGRMREQKAHLRAERKRLRELQKEQEKATKKLAKATERAQKKVEKEEAKAAAKKERDRLKAELKEEKKKAKLDSTSIDLVPEESDSEVHLSIPEEK